MRSQFWPNLLYILILLFLNSCTSPDNIRKPTSFEPEPTHLPSATPSQQPTSTPSPSLPEWTDLQCEVVVETTWGSGPGEFGCDKTTCSHQIAITDRGDIYLSDPMNSRIIKYAEGSSEPVEIYLPNKYHDVRFFWFSLDNDHFYILLESDDILILTSDGEIKTTFDINAYEPLRPVGQILADGHGGFYTILIEAGTLDIPQIVLLHYVDETNINLTDIDPQWAPKITSELISAMILGRNGRLYSSNIYNKIIHDWGQSNDPQFDTPSGNDRIETLVVHPELESFDSILLASVDQSGQFYALIRGPSDPPKNRYLTGYIRFNNRGEITNAGFFPVEWRNDLNAYWPQVAPDGSLYATAYDEFDLTISPKIVRCIFPESN